MMLTHHLIIDLVEMNLADFINNLLALEGDEPEASGKIEMK